MILNALMFLIAAAVLMQPNGGRALGACIFSGLTLFYMGISRHFGDVEYYIGAAATDLLILLLLSGIRPIPAMVVRLQAVCVGSILINFLGWAAWALYFPPTLYNSAFVLLYAYALYVLTRKDTGDVASGAVHSWGTRVRRNFNPRGSRAAKNEGGL